MTAQQSKKATPSPPAAPPKPPVVGVYYHTWEGGEIKSCFTYEEFASLLSCDSDDKSWEGSIGRVQDRLVAQIHQTFEEKMAAITRDTPNWEAKVNALSEEAKAQIRDITHERILALEADSTRKFTVKFSQPPSWPTTPPAPPAMGRATLWDCTKDDTGITCEFKITVGRRPNGTFIIPGTEK